MISSFKLSIFITLCHISLFFLNIGKIEPKKITKKIVIHTVHLIEEPFQYIQKENSTLSQETITKKENSTPPKEIKALVPTKKIVKNDLLKNKPVKKIEKKHLQNAINKSLSKSTPHTKNSLGKKTVKKDAGKSPNEYNQYLQEVCEILTDSLTLPEKGKVKLAITVHPTGKIVKIVSLFSESDDNLSYLEKSLGDLIFPKYKTNEERTFNITFSDEK